MTTVPNPHGFRRKIPGESVSRMKALATFSPAHIRHCRRRADVRDRPAAGIRGLCRSIRLLHLQNGSCPRPGAFEHPVELTIGTEKV